MYQPVNYENTKTGNNCWKMNEPFDNGQNLSIVDERKKFFNSPPFGNFSESFDNSTNVKLPDIRGESKYNAKIYLPEGENPPGYELYSGSRSGLNGQLSFNNSLTGILEQSDLSIRFFSKDNIDKIQKEIIAEVYKESEGQYIISRQSDLQLQIIMRGVYLTYGNGLYESLDVKLNELNKVVINDCMKSVMPNIKQYLHYRKDISTPRHIMSHPINPSSKGEKTYSLLNV